ncbi:MAG: gluconate 2-dehydrogenase subunit 3 family protein [Anaerolineae bacterium]|nr:gluconate 2-dehydrogenase subunit 3 family protein [Gemmatimonadaceae bacterium]
MSSETEQSKLPERTDSIDVISRREAVRRVSALLGGVALVGGSSLLTACEKARAPVAEGARVGAFTAEEIAFLDEVAETILPETKTPGAKAAKVGAFMALMVTDTYDERERTIFRDGMRKLDEASTKANKKSFMSATPEQRLSLLESLDREQKTYTDAREAARSPGAQKPAAPTDSAAERGDAYLPDQRKEAVPGQEAAGAAAITADAPSHYFRMMKELALLGYFTSEIGYTKAMRYVETPGRFDPCVPYVAGEQAWASHA